MSISESILYRVEATFCFVYAHKLTKEQLSSLLPPLVSQASWFSWKRKAKALSPGLFMASTFRQPEAPLHSL